MEREPTDWAQYQAAVDKAFDIIKSCWTTINLLRDRYECVFYHGVSCSRRHDGDQAQAILSTAIVHEFSRIHVRIQAYFDDLMDMMVRLYQGARRFYGQGRSLPLHDEVDSMIFVDSAWGLGRTLLIMDQPEASRQIFHVRNGFNCRAFTLNRNARLRTIVIGSGSSLRWPLFREDMWDELRQQWVTKTQD